MLLHNHLSVWFPTKNCVPLKYPCNSFSTDKSRIVRTIPNNVLLKTNGVLYEEIEEKNSNQLLINTFGLGN